MIGIWCLQGPCNNSNAKVCVCVSVCRRRVCWQICTVRWWSDMWVWGGHADCWLPRWPALPYVYAIDKRHIHHGIFPSNTFPVMWCDVMMVFWMLLWLIFTGFIGSCLLGLPPGVIHLHKRGCGGIISVSAPALSQWLSFLMAISHAPSFFPCTHFKGIGRVKLMDCA